MYALQAGPANSYRYLLDDLALELPVPAPVQPVPGRASRKATLYDAKHVSAVFDLGNKVRLGIKPVV